LVKRTYSKNNPAPAAAFPMRIRAPQEAKNKKHNGNLHRLGDASSFSVPSKALGFAGKN
jgi:hypothetical protein